MSGLPPPWFWCSVCGCAVCALQSSAPCCGWSRSHWPPGCVDGAYRVGRLRVLRRCGQRSWLLASAARFALASLEPWSWRHACATGLYAWPLDDMAGVSWYHRACLPQAPEGPGGPAGGLGHCPMLYEEYISLHVHCKRGRIFLARLALIVTAFRATRAQFYCLFA